MDGDVGNGRIVGVDEDVDAVASIVVDHAAPVTAVSRQMYLLTRCQSTVSANGFPNPHPHQTKRPKLWRLVRLVATSGSPHLMGR